MVLPSWFSVQFRPPKRHSGQAKYPRSWATSVFAFNAFGTRPVKAGFDQAHKSYARDNPAKAWAVRNADKEARANLTKTMKTIWSLD
jgi:hypothetical protein